MTCIVAHKENGNILMGGDSAGSNGHTYQVRKDKKVFIRDNMIFGFTSSFRMGNLLQYKLSIPKYHKDMSADTYIYTDFIDAVIKCFDNNGYTHVKDSVKSGGTFLIGFEGRIFSIEDDFQIGEVHEDYHACGSGYEAALGAMHAMSRQINMEPETMIKYALEAAENIIVSVRKPFYVLKLDGRPVSESAKDVR